MDTPDSPEVVEAGFSKFMGDLPNLLAGKTPHQKQAIIARLLGKVVISVEHATLGYWTVSTLLGTGIFSIERDTFLELPEGKGEKKYFSNITSKGVVPLRDGTEVLTFCFGGHIITPSEIIRIERFCYIENGQMQTFSDTPNPCSLKMATTLFQTKRNEEIARAKQNPDANSAGGE